MYHPHYSANGLCVKSVVDECVSKGYDVTCVVNSYYKEKTAMTVDGAKLYRIKAKLFDRVDQWCQRQKSKPFVKIIKVLALFCNKIKLLVTAPVWPLCSPLYTARFFKKAVELHKKYKFDAVVGVYTPVSSLMAGYKLKKKYPQIEFVPYFLDSLSGGYGPKNFSKEKIIDRGLRIEKKVFAQADKIVIMKSAEEHQSEYNKEFQNKICVLDIPMLKKVCFEESKKSTDEIKLLYVGSIQPSVRNPQVLIDTLKLLKNEKVNIEFVGKIDCKDLFDELKELYKDRLVFTDYLNHDKLTEKITQADVLINIGNRVSTMVPSKIFEYMSYGKPVISTKDIKDEPSVKYLNKYPLALILEEETGAQENVQRLTEFLDEAVNKRVAFDLIKKDLYLNTPEAFINEVLENDKFD